MGFFSGRLTSLRFKVAGKGPHTFGPEHLDMLAAHAIGKQRFAEADGSTAGWIAGDHILDTRFDLAKNVIDDTLHFALRIDSQAIPADLLRAYTQVELEGLAAGNPSGLPSARQKREAPRTRQGTPGNRSRRWPLSSPQVDPPLVGCAVAASFWSAPRRSPLWTASIRCSSRRSTMASISWVPAGKRFSTAS